MICFPNAKINLGLNVVSKRADGYHNIETIFYPIPLKDALEIVAAEAGSFSQTGIPVDAPAEKNLVVKAMNLLKEQYLLPPLEVHLLKAIPFGAGLGGGSSDAAFMLKLLNDFCQLDIPLERLEEIASAIGADCPFFVRNQPVFASGTGNIFEPVSLSLKGYHMCLVKPEIAVSTPEAYAMVTPRQPDISLKEIVNRPLAEWRELMVNDFEASVFPKYQGIHVLKEKLYGYGALYASMSGSGSSVFGLFEKPTDLKECFPSCFVWEGKLE
ncbi:4-diphosphocytidyl-2-C-methyl-D-erythritol kinase [Parabacteroides sp. PF5-5]|uniref:4-(cytidine 5'-diphospho)-2-C-methyl-D-erythritol kinase n=1 Tax=unclassified Parabacteroides TaxID=2649774 RepID=UPI00247343D6|nr:MULTISPECIES: 4-(cytidine 5'-diphospho)-2-C-methyl-D-erythritol kinase [unclassified Parabacteroides]MDH6305810.1 4-diphosphocytidyl-2-C-methyl-D-erythritol kinase [Parabacteroides sp. PH5-39]MDH6317753.1 4-diphosphocytidyl-2-C-methyl-D-erythritol kinase [Parabacteroides sp. PF5-13]MDH6320584.1 4-diphosphocytidyl-2-C-methyl-D-erythritol kinase [Parabacteroides sp. PH5-13]MDH6324253.1 4-diphosphocytidyl-2-C-methyl-D-erythritol kinase [Parabacteroides sp. PH5-8]MDH6328938.1 4-diphosphocytidyl